MKNKAIIFVSLLFLSTLFAHGEVESRAERVMNRLTFDNDSSMILVAEQYIKAGEFTPAFTVVACEHIWYRWKMPFVFSLAKDTYREAFQANNSLHVQTMYIFWLFQEYIFLGYEESLDDFRAYFAFCRENNIDPIIYEDPLWANAKEEFIKTSPVDPYRVFMMKIQDKGTHFSFKLTSEEEKLLLEILDIGISSGDRCCLLAKAFALCMRILPSETSANEMLTSIWPTDLSDLFKPTVITMNGEVLKE